MNRIWLSAITVAALSGPARGQKVEVQMPDREKIQHVQTALNHLTVLELSEPVSTVAVGSPVFKVEWRENKVFIEPTEADKATNLFVWTTTSRFNYELDPAGAVPQMVFAIDQPAADPPKINASMNRASEPTPAEVLIATKPIRLLGPISDKNRVAVYITDLLEHDGQVLIRCLIRNGTTGAYVPGIPQVVALNAPRYRESFYTLKNSQLGSDETHRIKSSGAVPIEVAKCEIHSSRIEAGQEMAAIVAIKLGRERSGPAVIQLAFFESPKGPVTATLVL